MELRTAFFQLISIKGMVKSTLLPFRDQAALLARLLTPNKTFSASQFFKKIVGQSTLSTHD